jgi:esterase/lipase
MWSLKSSPCRGAPHLAKINLPALVIQSLADTGVFPGDAKNIYELLGSKDKKLELTEGDHYLTKPVDARDKHADMIAGWLQQKL